MIEGPDRKPPHPTAPIEQPGVARLGHGNRLDETVAHQHCQPQGRRNRKPGQDTDHDFQALSRPRFSAIHNHPATIREWLPVRIRPDDGHAQDRRTAFRR